MKFYRHDTVNGWLFFDKIHFVIIHPNEREFHPNYGWSSRFNRLTIANKLEIQFGKIPDYMLDKGNLRVMRTDEP